MEVIESSLGLRMDNFDAHITNDSSKKPVEIIGTAQFDALPVGAIIHDRYEILQLLGVKTDLNWYLAQHSKTKEKHLLYESKVSSLFDGEKNLFSQRLSHRALVMIVDVFKEVQYGNNERGYLATEFPLDSVTPTLDWTEAEIVQIGLSLVEALAYLHENGFQHGSLGIDSIYLSDGRVKLGAFSQIVPISSEGREHDLYDLTRTLSQFADSIRKAGGAISPALLRVLERGLSSDSSDRYHFAIDFASDLRRVLDNLRRPQIMKLTVGCLTDRGRMSEANEDSVLVLEKQEYFESNSQTIGLYAIADGIGGTTAGEVASRLVIESLARNIITRVFLNDIEKRLEEDSDYSELLKSITEDANVSVYAARVDAHNDMGSTLVAALFIDGKIHIANIGDSRAYLARDGSLLKITYDHSLVQTLVDRGEITEDEMRKHPKGNIITRSIGEKLNPKIDLFSIPAQLGDRFMLCSDGLWEMVANDELLRIITSTLTPQEACREMVQVANDAGGDDNISCILLYAETL